MKPRSAARTRCAGGAKSRTPGASMIAAPSPSGYQRAVVVVWRPSTSRVNSAVCAAASGASALTSEDLPTPDCPTSSVTRSASKDFELGDAGARVRAHFGAIQTQIAIGGEFRLNGRRAQIELVDDDQATQVLQHRTRPVAVDQEPIGRGFRGRDDGQLIDVGGDGLGTAAGIDAFDEVAARLDGFEPSDRRPRAGSSRRRDRRTRRAACAPTVRSAASSRPPAPRRRGRNSRGPCRCRRWRLSIRRALLPCRF